MKLLGIRVDEHDANYTLYNNGRIEYIKTERVTGEKHHAHTNLWEWKIDVEKYFDIDADSLDEIAIVSDNYKHGIEQSVDDPYMFLWDYLPNANCPVWKVDHHHAHAYSEWPIQQTDIQFVIDGYGDKYRSDDRDFVFSTASVYRNKNLEFRSVDKEKQGVVPSLGLVYDVVASQLFGLTSPHGLDNAGKFMSLQSYGNFDSEFYDKFLSNTDPFPEGLLQIFDLHLWSDYKGSLEVAENTKLDWITTVHEYMGDELVRFFNQFADKNDRISYSGGVAQNIIWNTKLKKAFPNLVVLPHCADGGLSFGALAMLCEKHDITLSPIEQYPFCQSDWSPGKPTQKTIDKAAHLLADGKILGWYQGHGEVGPRALGNRCILIDPSLEHGKEKINKKVKGREGFRPFSGTVLTEHRDEYFDLPFENPYMLYLSNMKKDLPAIQHVDNTCRHQTLSDENPVYRDLIKSFYDITGIPILLNTSLNIGGKPIAGTKRDALKVFYETELDALFIGNEYYHK